MSGGQKPARPNMRLGAVVIDCANPAALADFYAELLAWEKHTTQDGEWVFVKPHKGAGTPLVFQHEPAYVPPVWPAKQGAQQQMEHLDIYLENVAEGVAYALACGARVCEYQPSDDWRVMLDPEGHPFCLLPLKDPSG